MVNAEVTLGQMAMGGGAWWGLPLCQSKHCQSKHYTLLHHSCMYTALHVLNDWVALARY